ncbi:hypothetical protein ACHAPQ_006032 [Fusarium lateritium]
MVTTPFSAPAKPAVDPAFGSSSSSLILANMVQRGTDGRQYRWAGFSKVLKGKEFSIASMGMIVYFYSQTQPLYGQRWFE